MKNILIYLGSLVVLFVFHGCRPDPVFQVGKPVASSMANVVGNDGWDLSVVVNDSLGNRIMDDNLFVKVFRGEVLQFFDYDNPVHLALSQETYIVHVGFPLDPATIQTRTVVLNKNVSLVIGMPF